MRCGAVRRDSGGQWERHGPHDAPKASHSELDLPSPPRVPGRELLAKPRRSVLGPGSSLDVIERGEDRDSQSRT